MGARKESNEQKELIAKIDGENEELAKIKGFKKFDAASQIKRLSQQKVEYEKAYSDMQSRMDWIDKNSTRADEIKKRISEEQDQRILNEVRSGFGFIKSE